MGGGQVGGRVVIFKCTELYCILIKLVQHGNTAELVVVVWVECKRKVWNHTFCTNGYKPHSFRCDKIQGLVHIGDLVEAHFPTLWGWELFTWNHLKEHHKFETIAEVWWDLFDICIGLPQVGVAPCCKCLYSKERYQEKMRCNTGYKHVDSISIVSIWSDLSRFTPLH